MQEKVSNMGTFSAKKSRLWENRKKNIRSEKPNEPNKETVENITSRLKQAEERLGMEEKTEETLYI